MARIDIDDLAAEIANELIKYTDRIVVRINTSTERIGKKAVRALRQPPTPKLTGAYRKSWKMTTEIGSGGRLYDRYIHAAAPEYRLAHLLEYGHVKAGGGRVEARPHIARVEQEVIREFIAEVEEAIRDG